MSKGATTKDLLLTHARRLFWSRGYSNVTVRDVSRAAGVDVALIARYFGSKLGLFEATLDTLTPVDPNEIGTVDMLIGGLVEMYANPPPELVEASPISMILMNANDDEVGALVAERQHACWQRPLEQIVGSKPRAAVFFAALMGFSVAQKTLKMDGIAPAGSADHRAQLEHILRSALASPEF